jgi:hypothetical protein
MIRRPAVFSGFGSSHTAPVAPPRSASGMDRQSRSPTARSATGMMPSGSGPYTGGTGGAQSASETSDPKIHFGLTLKPLPQSDWRRVLPQFSPRSGTVRTKPYYSSRATCRWLRRTGRAQPGGDLEGLEAGQIAARGGPVSAVRGFPDPLDRQAGLLAVCGGGVRQLVGVHVERRSRATRSVPSSIRISGSWPRYPGRRAASAASRHDEAAAGLEPAAALHPSFTGSTRIRRG